MIALIFPGQGSQRRGMGVELFDTVRQFSDWEPKIDSILGYSFRDLCLNDPNNNLRATEYTQPALYVINHLHYCRALDDGAVPEFAAGHSLGEYNALLAAGAFDFFTGLRLVQKRGALMSEVKNGGMAAVIGLSPETVARLLHKERIESVVIANFNSPTQVVLSGAVDEIKKLRTLFEQAGAKSYISLSVSAAFHSPTMEGVAVQFRRFLDQFSFNRLSLPVISNFTGLPYPSLDPDAFPDLLAQQILSPVKWIDCIKYLVDRQVNEFREVGPGNVLSGLVAQITAKPVQ